MRKHTLLFSSASLLLLICGCVATALITSQHMKVLAEPSKDSSEKSITALPMHGPVTGPTALPMLTRDDLVTHGHADDKEEIADLFYTYIFYHDSHNGPGVASLFTEDGILETLWNDGGKTFEPNAGPHGKGCLEYGHKQIADMFGYKPLPFVGHSHNQVSNVMVQVPGAGDTATLYANWTTIRSNDSSSPNGNVATAPNTAIVSHNGEYIGDLRHTPEGWRFLHLRVAEDEPAKFGIPVCEENVLNAQK